MSVQAESEALWTPEDVSAYLGIPVTTIYKWRSEGSGPLGAKVGRHLRFLPDDVRAWVREQRAAA